MIDLNKLKEIAEAECPQGKFRLNTHLIEFVDDKQILLDIYANGNMRDFWDYTANKGMDYQDKGDGAFKSTEDAIKYFRTSHWYQIHRNPLWEDEERYNKLVDALVAQTPWMNWTDRGSDDHVYTTPQELETSYFEVFRYGGEAGYRRLVYAIDYPQILKGETDEAFLARTVAAITDVYPKWDYKTAVKAFQKQLPEFTWNNDGGYGTDPLNSLVLFGTCSQLLKTGPFREDLDITEATTIEEIKVWITKYNLWPHKWNLFASSEVYYGEIEKIIKALPELHIISDGCSGETRAYQGDHKFHINSWNMGQHDRIRINGKSKKLESADTAESLITWIRSVMPKTSECDSCCFDDMCSNDEYGTENGCDEYISHNPIKNVQAYEVFITDVVKYTPELVWTKYPEQVGWKTTVESGYSVILDTFKHHQIWHVTEQCFKITETTSIAECRDYLTQFFPKSNPVKDKASYDKFCSEIAAALKKLGWELKSYDGFWNHDGRDGAYTVLNSRGMNTIRRRNNRVYETMGIGSTTTVDECVEFLKLDEHLKHNQLKITTGFHWDTKKGYFPPCITCNLVDDCPSLSCTSSGNDMHQNLPPTCDRYVPAKRDEMMTKEKYTAFIDKVAEKIKDLGWNIRRIEKNGVYYQSDNYTDSPVYTAIWDYTSPHILIKKIRDGPVSELRITSDTTVDECVAFMQQDYHLHNILSDRSTYETFIKEVAGHFNQLKEFAANDGRLYYAIDEYRVPIIYAWKSGIIGIHLSSDRILRFTPTTTVAECVAFLKEEPCFQPVKAYNVMMQAVAEKYGLKVNEWHKTNYYWTGDYCRNHIHIKAVDEPHTIAVGLRVYDVKDSDTFETVCAKIEEYLIKPEIVKEVRKMEKKCVQCKKEIRDDAEFCSFCGTKQVAEVKIDWSAQFHPPKMIDAPRQPFSISRQFEIDDKLSTPLCKNCKKCKLKRNWNPINRFADFKSMKCIPKQYVIDTDTNGASHYCAEYESNGTVIKCPVCGFYLNTKKTKECPVCHQFKKGLFKWS